jgi:hypothetical protein
MPDLARAAAFMATHARILDRHRFALALGRRGGAAPALAALAAYAKDDGGYGHGLEPDLRSAPSQPGGALHAFEVLAEVAPATSPAAARLLGWLDTATLPDGGLPFALPGAGGPGDAPWWAAGDPSASSLHATAMVAAGAVRVGAHDPDVAGHPWIARAVAFCRPRIEAIASAEQAIEIRFVLDLLDALAPQASWAAAELERIAGLLPADLILPVPGGADGEHLRPLDLAPRPGSPLRAHVDPAVITADLDRLDAEQDADGGWHVDFVAQSPAGALEWRGYATVRAVALLAGQAAG